MTAPGTTGTRHGPALVGTGQGPAPEDGYTAWYRQARALSKSPRRAPARRCVRLAVLASYTTDFLADLLPVAADRNGLAVEFAATPFAQLEQVLLAPQPVLGPGDYAVLSGTAEDLTGGVDDVVKRWTSLWNAADLLGVRVLQMGFAPPAVDPYGSTAWRTPQSLSGIAREVNTALAKEAADRAIFIDVEQLAAQVGLDRWEDRRSWYRIRQPYAHDSLPWLACAIADALAADQGLNRRCVVVDLDDTLWGGSIGEVGIDGVRVGTGAGGEPFAAFQTYLRGLADRGVALAVASKNDRDLALQALSEVPGMVLRPAHFAHVSADWRPKSEQVAEIAATLRLGLCSLVFADDNPAEVAQVAAALPEVYSVCLPSQPSLYPAALASVPGLRAGALSDADRGRADSYRGLAAAAELADRSENLADFLRGLDMNGTLRPVSEATLARAAQLTAKTNQFNLTTRRRTQPEILALMRDPSWYLATLSLRDRFADHGEVGLVAAYQQHGTAELDTLLLSCRVIGRTAEQCLLFAASAWARERGCERLIGRYLPTSRNALVRDLYPGFGFTPRPDDGPGMAFVFDLTADPVPTSAYIDLTEDGHAR